MGEKFAANPVTGTGRLSVPVPTSHSRSGFTPQLSLAYDSGSGNGPFGFGWSLSSASITRKTDKGLPQYRDDEESDVFLLSGAEDLVPERKADGSLIVDATIAPGFVVHRYRPRIEEQFARIERWTLIATGETHWRSITRDNVTTLYGRTNESRIFDPDDDDIAHPTRVFSWLICETSDASGNVIEYEYAAEDSAGVSAESTCEANRNALHRTATRYLKRIRYGNTVSRLDSTFDGLNEWLFEIVLDYGEHDALVPTPVAAFAWLSRNDPFSSYRAAFEVRTYRLCQRFLMFHHFRDESDVGLSCLVRSLDLRYRSTRGVASDAQRGNPRASFLDSVTASGYRRDGAGYLKRSLPSLDFTYSTAVVSSRVETVDRESLENVPSGLDDTYQWLDLYGEGVSGIFSEQGNEWFYKRNLSPRAIEDVLQSPTVIFAPQEQIELRPSVSMGRQSAQFMDLSGAGQPDLVLLDGPNAGFFEVVDGEQWSAFRAFESRPSISLADANLRLIDLNGDGRADLLITNDRVFTWFPSLAESGFGEAVRVPVQLDEDAGPAVVFADESQSIHLADMSGDGLADLVRIRNGEVSYWPNLGFGRFGARITMDNSPWFESEELFDQRRLRLADIDGSGCVDLLYLDAEGVRIYTNCSGNAWSSAGRVTGLPRIDDVASVATVDLFGNGTACLVWSSSFPEDAGTQMQYVDLMGGVKPNLLISAANNLGAETHIKYASSASFYLRDKLAGTPWITRLPFPVHVVERVEIRDIVSGNAFVTRYAYHHGFFDGEEREFRGFGMVEQWDTERFAALEALSSPPPSNIDEASHVPPVYTKSWFHTGVFLDRDRISCYFAGLSGNGATGEYYREPLWRTNDVEAERRLLDDTLLPVAILRADGSRIPYTLTSGEEREACRALRGMMLRQEVYGLDDSPKAVDPYTTIEQNFTVELLQPRGDGAHAVFAVHSREELNYHYERDPTDPRVGHSLTLEVDAFGNVLRKAAAAYGRRQPDLSLASADQLLQGELHVTCTEHRFTNSVTGTDTWRSPLPSESRSHEITGLALSPGALRYTFAEIDAAMTAGSEITYESVPAGVAVQKRLLAHVRTRYRPDDLGASAGDALALLPLHQLESLGLQGETVQLAFTSGLIASVYGTRVTNAMLSTEARYVHSEGDSDWWTPSGRAFLSPDPSNTAAMELAYARKHFFLPRRFRDPFHTTTLPTETVISYDRYDLLVQETQDAVGNRVTVGERDAGGSLTAQGNDYRVLQPRLVTDANGNRSALVFDALGLVSGSATMGKPLPAAVEGDSLAIFDPDLPETVVLAHLADPLLSPAAVIQGASTRLLYDLFAYARTKTSSEPQPAVIYTISRETHVSDPAPSAGFRFQHTFGFSDGLGREIQRKVQAEPGPVPIRDSAGHLVLGSDGAPAMTAGSASPRWVGSGWTIFNNKGKAVRQFEPFFTDTQLFERDVRVGVSPILFYDPLGRVVGKLHPNHTWDKVVFDSWRQESWDASDTVLIADPATDVHLGGFFARLPNSDFLATWYAARVGGALGADERAAALKASIHAGTPGLSYADSLGRVVLVVAHNKFLYSNAGAGSLPTEELDRSRTLLDIDGHVHAVSDAMNRIVMRYEYDMQGHRTHSASMEAGSRWMLADALGTPMYGWDSRDHRYRSDYDAAHRPTASIMREGSGPDIVVGKTVYGETIASPEANNLRGRPVRLYDQAGVVSTDAYDFKGNALVTTRRLCQSFDATIDWSGLVSLEVATYASRSRYDALNRVVQRIAPHSAQSGATVNVIQPSYNVSTLLEQVDVWMDQITEPPTLLAAASATLHAITNVDYDAKGRRSTIAYGNGATTTYAHDLLSSRLTRLRTQRAGDVLQDMTFTYDAAGNITHIRDDAQQTLFFKNRRVEPSADYTYDALGRIIEATGREHLSAAGARPTPSSYDDRERTSVAFASEDGSAMGRYLERYVYDSVGNFESMQHGALDPSNPGWTRNYFYEEPSELDAGAISNRLTRTSTDPVRPEIYSVAQDGYDAHGNMLRMPHLQEMRWDYGDQLRMTRRQAINTSDAAGVAHAGERTWYVYDGTGQRVRKVTVVGTNSIVSDRIYLTGFEIYRRTGSAAVVRETLHIMDNRERIALVETRTEGNEPGIARQRVRYQITNHLGSANLELDAVAKVISYEEYTPYGSTSYQAVRSATESSKRYRFTGKERDEENGFYYHGARYYAPWLGRWTACDPSERTAGIATYTYAAANPVKLVDGDGRWPTLSELKSRAEATALSIGTSLDRGITAIATHPTEAATGALNALGSLAKDKIVGSVSELPGVKEATLASQATVLAAQVATPEGRKALIAKTADALEPAVVSAYRGYSKSIAQNDSADVAVGEGFLAYMDKSPFFTDAAKHLLKADAALQSGDVTKGSNELTRGGVQFTEDVASLTLMFEGATSAGGGATATEVASSAKPRGPALTGNPAASKTPATIYKGARRSQINVGNAFAYGTVTDGEVVANLTSKLEASGQKVAIGTGGHGEFSGPTPNFISNPALAESNFLLEDLDLGWNPNVEIFDLTNSYDYARFKSLETAAAAGTGNGATIRAWCFSANHPLP